MRKIFLALGSATLLGAVAPVQTGNEETAIEGYRKWFCDTPEAVDMAPRIALSCIGPAEWDRSPENPHVRTLFKVYVNSAGRRR